MQNSDKEHLPERAHCVVIVSAVSQHSAGSPRRGEGHHEGTPFGFEFSWVHRVSQIHLGASCRVRIVALASRALLETEFKSCQGLGAELR